MCAIGATQNGGAQACISVMSCFPNFRSLTPDQQRASAFVPPSAQRPRMRLPFSKEEKEMPRNNDMPERDSRGRFVSDDNDRGGGRSGGQGGSTGRDRDSRGRFLSDDDDRDYARHSSGRYDDRSDRDRDQRGRFVSDDDRGRSGRSADRYDDDDRRSSRSRDDDDRRSSRGRDDDDSRGRGQGGWFGDSEGHAEASRRGWDNRRR